MHFKYCSAVNTGTKKHIGIVTQLEENGSVRVKISRNQCEGCKLGDICGVTGDELELMCGNMTNDDVVIGDKVIVEEEQSLEWSAILFCLFLPCVLFLSVVIGLSAVVSILWGCVLGIAVLAVYYGLFYAVGNKLNFNKVNFVIKRFK